MSSKDQNLSKSKTKKSKSLANKKVGVVISKWNDDITSSLSKACIAKLKKAGIKQDNIYTIEVPGSFELPFGAKTLMKKNKLDAVICIGCVIKGETDHDKYISTAVTNGIMQLGLISGTPVIFGVLTPNTKEQALDRAGGKYGNKGDEAAHTAIEMMSISDNLFEEESKIGF